MPSSLPPLLLAIGALGGGWWLGSRSSTGDVPPSTPAKGIEAAGTGTTLPSSGLARRAALLKKLEHPSADEIRRLLDEGKLSPQDVNTLTMVWAKQDPAGMWSWLEHGGRKKLGAVDLSYVIFDEWLRSDPDAALSAYRNMAYEFRLNAAHVFLSRLLTADDALRRKILPLLDDLASSGGALRVETGREAEQAAQLLALPASAGRDALLTRTAYAWASRDWKAAVAWTASLAEPMKSKIAESLASSMLSPSFRMSGSPADRSGARDREVLAWMGEWLNASPGDMRRKLGLGYVKVLAEKDGGAALAWAQENLHAASLTEALKEVLLRQAVKDPAQSRAMVEQLPPGNLRERACFAAAGNGSQAVEWLLSRVNGSAQGWSDLGHTWAFDHPEEFQKFVTAQNIGTLPKNLLSAAIYSMTDKDPAGTLAWTAGLKAPDLIGSALQQWSQTNALAAATWLKENPGVPVDVASVPPVAVKYFRRSASEAVEWAAALPSGPVREASVAAIRKQLSSTSSLKPEQRTALETKLGKP